MNQNFEENFAPSGAEESVKTVKKVDFYKKWWFWAIIAAAVIIIGVIAGSSGPDLIDLPEDEYKAKCQVYTYDAIARNPDDYERKLAKFTGEVVQVLRDGDELQMRVDVTPTGYGFYEDTVFVFYTVKDGANVLEGDVITMYGELRGLQEYETIFGETVSIPRIYVKFVDILY